MKKLVLALWLACLALGATAQDKKTVTLVPVKKSEEPKAVMDALKKDFPEAMVKNLSFLPDKLYGQEWNIDVSGDQEVEPFYYEVNIKKENEDYVAVYNKEGKLLSSMRVVQNATLPEAVMNVVKKFPGWHIDKTQEITEYKHKGFLENYYKIKIQQGLKHKNLFVTPKGDIMKERVVIDIGD